MPPAKGDNRSWANVCAFFAASPSAPTIRSCNVSTSDGSTTFGSICTPSTSPLPLEVTLTRPPPASPCTSVTASSCCAASSFCCICCAWANSADMSGGPPGPPGPPGSPGPPGPPGCMNTPLTSCGVVSTWLRLGFSWRSDACETPSVVGGSLPWPRARTSSLACRRRGHQLAGGDRHGAHRPVVLGSDLPHSRHVRVHHLYPHPNRLPTPR